MTEDQPNCSDADTSDLSTHDQAADRCPKCGGTHSGRYEGACGGPPTPSAPPPHRMQG